MKLHSSNHSSFNTCNRLQARFQDRCWAATRAESTSSSCEQRKGNPSSSWATSATTHKPCVVTCHVTRGLPFDRCNSSEICVILVWFRFCLLSHTHTHTWQIHHDSPRAVEPVPVELPLPRLQVLGLVGDLPPHAARCHGNDGPECEPLPQALIGGE